MLIIRTRVETHKKNHLYLGETLLRHMGVDNRVYAVYLQITSFDACTSSPRTSRVLVLKSHVKPKHSSRYDPSLLNYHAVVSSRAGAFI